jgi:Mce-associated membrane protein
MRRTRQATEEIPAETPALTGTDSEATAIDEATGEATDETTGEATDASIQAPAEKSDNETAEGAPAPRPRRANLRRALVFGLLPGLVMLLAAGVGYLKWQKATLSETQTARIESVQAATDITIKMLSYNPDTVDHDLDAARDRLTGTFRDAYSQLTHDVIIPGAKQKKISAVANVPTAASISASPNRAVVMVFVNQSVVQGNGAPSNTASAVRITLDKRDNRWLISDFTPI